MNATNAKPAFSTYQLCEWGTAQVLCDWGVGTPRTLLSHKNFPANQQLEKCPV